MLFENCGFRLRGTLKVHYGYKETVIWNIITNTTRTAAADITMSMGMSTTITSTAMTAAADITMNTDMSTITNTATTAIAAVTTIMSMNTITMTPTPLISSTDIPMKARLWALEC